MMQDLQIDQVRCSKPKKMENTYVCQLYLGDTPKTKLSLSFQNSKIIQVKHAFQQGDYIVYMKNKKMHDILYDLNTYIVDYTRKHCSDWFGNNMNPELLEDYFSNPLFYMKNHGDVIKLKCVGSPNINEFVEKTVDLSLTITNLRFFKQKFMYECRIEAVALVGSGDVLNTDVEDIDDEDLPQPTEDEINILREEFKQILSTKRNNMESRQEELQSEMYGLNSRLFTADKFLSILEKENIKLEEILEIGDQLDDF